MYLLLFSFNVFWGSSFLSEIVAYKGIDYSSPTLASAIGNLTPALTFMLAIFFRFHFLLLLLQTSIVFPFLSLHPFLFWGCLCNCNCFVSLHPAMGKYPKKERLNRICRSAKKLLVVKTSKMYRLPCII